VDQEPPNYERVEPRYFGLTPHVLAASLGVVAALAGILLIASGSAAVGVLLLVAGVLLAFVFVEQARHRRATSLDRAAAAAVDNSLAVAGFTGATVGSWTAAGREAAKLRLEAKLLARRRARVQYELGGAVHGGEDDRAETLREEMAALDADIETCTRGARAAIARAQSKMRQERKAMASTQVFKKPSRPPG
jgi:hypothetical protein